MRQHHFVVFTADTGLLVTTECSMRWIQVIAIGPHTSGFDRPAHAISTVYITSPQTCTETEFRVISNRQGFGFVFEGGDADHWTKNFFLENTHFVVTFQQSRLDVIATL